VIGCSHCTVVCRLLSTDTCRTFQQLSGGIIPPTTGISRRLQFGSGHRERGWLWTVVAYWEQQQGRKYPRGMFGPEV
jgi:hypothetical protein